MLSPSDADTIRPKICRQHRGWSLTAVMNRVRVLSLFLLLLTPESTLPLVDRLPLTTPIQAFAQSNRPAEKPEGPDGWLGLVLHTRGGIAFVKRVVEGWPAHEGGLLPGDQLLSVDGIIAQAPRLNRALNQLAGIAGTAVEVRVLRPGVAQPISARLIRTALAAPPQRNTQAKTPASPSSLIQEAINRLKPGDDALLRQMLEVLERARPTEVAELYRDAIYKLMERDTDHTLELARTLAIETILRFPASEEAAEALLRATPLEDKKGILKETSRQVLELLQSPPVGLSVESLNDARHRAKVMELIGSARKSAAKRHLKKLDPLLRLPETQLIALRVDGSVLWKATARPAFGSESALELAMAHKVTPAILRGLERILRYDQPPIVETALDQLRPLDREDLIIAGLTPRWPLPRVPAQFRELTDLKGTAVALKDIQKGQPTLLLWCGDSSTACESWRIALTTQLMDSPIPELTTGLILAGPPQEGAAELSWPAWFMPAPTRSPARVTLLDKAGTVVSQFDDWEPGLEHRLLRQVRDLKADDSTAGPYLANGGTGLNDWELHWSRAVRQETPLAFSLPGHSTPRLWLLSSPETLEVIEDGQPLPGLEGLGDVSRLWTAELDGDNREELVLYHTRDQLLEALDPSGTPRWILPEEQSIDLVLLADLTRDGKQELLYTRQGESRLSCLAPDRDTLWTWPGAGGILAIAAGKVELDSTSLVVVSRSGTVSVLDAKGLVKQELKPGIIPRHVALADLDGDGIDEIVLANRKVNALTAGDLNGDGMAEVVALAGQHQVLIFEHEGTLASRLSWDMTGSSTVLPTLRMGDMDGDGRQELSLATPRHIALLSWQKAGEQKSSTK